MKKLFIILMFFMFAGCGDEITEINGMTEEEILSYINENKINVEITNKDTVLSIITKTVYDTIFDTTIIEHKDTILISKIDSIIVKDTVYNYDTLIYIKDEELPRDTTIKFMHNDSIILFDGYVYKNKFFQKEKYNAVVGYNNPGYGNVILMVDIGSDSKNRCGTKAVPDSIGDVVWKHDTRRNAYYVSGFRKLEHKDVYEIFNVINFFINNDESILLNFDLSNATYSGGYKSYKTEYFTNMFEYAYGNHTGTLKYMCVYEFNDEEQ